MSLFELHMLTSQWWIRGHISHWLMRPTRNARHKWIFSFISSRFSVLPFCLAPLFNYSFFFSNLHFWRQLSRRQWLYYSQLICVMPLSTCNYAKSWWVCFGAVIAPFHFTFFAFLHCCIASLFFQILHVRWQLSCRQGQYCSQLIRLIDCFPNYCLGARRGKDLVAKGCYGPWRILLNVNPPRFPVCYSV